MNEQVMAELSKISRKRELATAMYKRDLATLAAESEFWRSQCEHSWHERSIMGRETVTECRHCGKER